MRFEWLYVAFIVVTVLNYIFLDIKVDKMKKESIEKDKLISAFAALDKAISKLNNGFKDHEKRLNDIEWKRSSLPRDGGEPDESEFTCKDCEYYRTLYGNYYMCNQTGCFCSTECDKPCDVFKKKESPNEDENAVYANNVKINISSNSSRLYMADRLLTSEELIDRIRKLYLDGGISFDDTNTLLERLKQ